MSAIKYDFCPTSVFFTLLMYIHLFVSSVCVTGAILTAATHHVQLCVLSTVTDTTTALMVLSMITTLIVRSTCLK